MNHLTSSRVAHSPVPRDLGDSKEPEDARAVAASELPFTMVARARPHRAGLFNRAWSAVRSSPTSADRTALIKWLSVGSLHSEVAKFLSNEDVWQFRQVAKVLKDLQPPFDRVWGHHGLVRALSNPHLVRLQLDRLKVEDLPLLDQRPGIEALTVWLRKGEDVVDVFASLPNMLKLTSVTCVCPPGYGILRLEGLALNAPNLRHLELIRFRHSDNLFQCLKPLSELQSLSLDCFALTDAAIKDLVPLSQLCRLKLRLDWKFYEPNMLPSLAELRVPEIEIRILTDKCLRNLAKDLPQNIKLVIESTSLSLEDTQDFRQARPDLDVSLTYSLRTSETCCNIS